MALGWESLPLLPLRCVMDHLSLADTLTATAVCRNWRNALIMFEGHRDLVRLQTKQTEKNLFLARLFRRNVTKLHVHIDCEGEQLDKFFSIVLPEFFDSVKLEEIIFIGPSYLQHNYRLSPAKLNRVVTESLVFKNSHCISNLALFWCEMDAANDNDRYMHEQIEYYSRPLSFDEMPSIADSVLSRSNSSLMVFSTLQHIAVDYDYINTSALETLSHLPLFSHLSLVISEREAMQPLRWDHIAPCYPNGLDVSLHIVSLPFRKFSEVIDNVLLEGMCLISIKVYFCKTLYAPLLTALVRYKHSLRELVWADCPYNHMDSYHRVVKNLQYPQIDACNINPFILLCWQCVNLRRLVIHGYWIWQYDVLGFVRLRNTLQQLEISAIYAKRTRFQSKQAPPDVALRVLERDAPGVVQQHYVQQINQLTEFEWLPPSWSSLHRALQARSTPPQRAEYISSEVMRPVPPPVQSIM
ncbi:uncharacterized protein LOC126377549 [Pectinophora gossypiella]|uniref:uncharacterized protein LOC126377549 n=1 Tax=Pectinophora gossypiella TaxID=13191 RepID=UPI00214EEEE5|nr:uncharacterized protein LOC126377549 [Pectinophora gossypiella]